MGKIIVNIKRNKQDNGIILDVKTKYKKHDDKDKIWTNYLSSSIKKLLKNTK